MPRPTVLILGAAGRLGHAAVQAFAAAGWQVLAQQRRAPAGPLPAGATHIGTPLQDTETLAAQAKAARVVVYAVNPAYDRWDAELLPLAQALGPLPETPPPVALRRALAELGVGPAALSSRRAPA